MNASAPRNRSPTKSSTERGAVPSGVRLNLSSFEPDDSGGKVDRHPEFSGGFIVARRNCSELFHRTREILDEMAFPIGFAVEFEQVQAGSAWTGSQLICRRLPVARGPVCRHRRPSRRSTEQPPFSAGARPCRPRSCACPGGGMNAKGLPSAFDRGVDFGVSPPQPRPITCSSSFGRARRRYAGEPRTILLSITSLTYY